jgi:hypothetical protein
MMLPRQARNVCPEHEGVFGYGNVWTWRVIDAETKFLPPWHVGLRTGEDAAAFIENMAGRVASRVQLTTDGIKVYREAVEGAFGADIDYAMLIKHYGPDLSGEKRQNPTECIGTETHLIVGDPGPVACFHELR